MITKFKDVAHLYLGVQCKTKFNENSGLNDDDYTMLDAELLEYLLREDCEVKPILRPLSEMTRIENDGYFFQTQSSGFDPCKSPMGMFDEMLIPNDLNYVIQKIKQYYEGDDE